MGTMMYFLLKMSTFDDHFRTLGYASANLARQLAPSHASPSGVNRNSLFLAAQFLVEEGIEDVNLLCHLRIKLAQIV